MKKIKIAKSVALCGCLWVMIAACKAHITTHEAAPPQSEAIHMLLMPFEDMSLIYGKNVHVRSPLSGKMFLTGQVADGADKWLSENLTALMRKRSEFSLMTAEQAQGVRAELISEGREALAEKDLLLNVGRALGVDTVMQGHVYRFVERAGSNYSVNSPASITFDVDIIQVADGRLVWSGHFNETQKSLSENLFQLRTFIKRGGRWITAQEMAFNGLEDLLKKFKP